MLAIVFIIMALVQIGNLVYWVLTKLHLTKAYKLDTKTIVKDLGYTMKQYYSSHEICMKISDEYVKRVEELR